jgi:spoIIIJ-associated protein
VGDDGTVRTEAEGETVGEARYNALRALRDERPDLAEADVDFEVLSEGRRTMLGRVTEPARVVATVRGPGPEVGATPASPGGAALAEALRAILEGLGVQGRAEVRDDGEGGLTAVVTGTSAGRLVGRGGEVIDAAQFLLAQIASRAEGGERRRVVLDADGYRARRTAELERLAARAAAEVLRSGDEIELDPMSPQDRRVVHLALADRPDVATRSEGEEGRRRVIVEPVED